MGGGGWGGVSMWCVWGEVGMWGVGWGEHVVCVG